MASLAPTAYPLTLCSISGHFWVARGWGQGGWVRPLAHKRHIPSPTVSAGNHGSTHVATLSTLGRVADIPMICRPSDR